MSPTRLCKLVFVIFYINLNTCNAQLGMTPVGEDCSRHDDCKGYPATTRCNEVQICWCLDHLLMVPVGNELLCLRKAAQVGDECLVDVQCQQGEPGSLSRCFPSSANPSNLVCSCTENAIHQPPNQRCYPRAQHLGDSCVVQNQCTVNLGSNSLCSATQHVCECNQFSFPNSENNYCLPILDNIGDECTVSNQCKYGAPGEYSDCLVSSDPTLPVGTKVCTCTDDAIYDSTTGTDECYPRRVFLGDDCIIDVQCTVNMGSLSECYQQTCTCKPEGVDNDDETFCLEKATQIGQECTEPQQCKVGAPGQFSDCVPSETDPERRLCQCISDGIQEPGNEVCLRKATRVGDLCTHPIQCTSALGSLSECSATGTCSCIDGQSIPSQFSDSCLQIVNTLGDACLESSQCQSGNPGPLSTCQGGTCQCSPDATNEPGEQICRPRAGYIGGDCDLNSQCKANLGDLSECLGRQCVCTPSGGIPSNNRLRCLAIINFLGGNCIQPQQCTSGDPGIHSNCVPSSTPPAANVCTCNNNAVSAPGNHACHLKSEKVGDSCEIVEQCKTALGDLSECNNNFCTCVTGQSIPKQDNTLCLPIQDTIGDTCQEDQQCLLGALGQYSACMRSDQFPYQLVCNCTDEAVPNPSRRACHRKAFHVGDPCVISTQCLANIYVNMSCNEDKCIEYKIVGDKCTKDAECTQTILGKVYCDKSTSVCMCYPSYSSAMQGKACLSVAGVTRICKDFLLFMLAFVFVMNKIMS